MTRFTNRTKLEAVALFDALCSYKLDDMHDKCSNVKSISLTMLDGDSFDWGYAEGFKNKPVVNQVIEEKKVEKKEEITIDYFVIENYQIVFA